MPEANVFWFEISSKNDSTFSKERKILLLLFSFLSYSIFFLYHMALRGLAPLKYLTECPENEPDLVYDVFLWQYAFCVPSYMQMTLEAC